MLIKHSKRFSIIETPRIFGLFQHLRVKGSGFQVARLWDMVLSRYSLEHVYSIDRLGSRLLLLVPYHTVLNDEVVTDFAKLVHDNGTSKRTVEGH